MTSMRRKLLFTITFVGALAASVFIITCHRAPSNGTETAKISINSWIGWAPLFLAENNHIFENNGVKVDLVRIEDTGARKATMMSGQVDGYATSVDNFQLDSSFGVPGRIVMLFDESFGGDG